MKRKIMIIGTGGIGSFLIPLLDKTKLYRITAFDPDIVEVKNLTYQNFEMREIEEKRVKALQQRYSSIVTAEPSLVLTERQIEGYEFGTNPCSEIILRDREFCNLSEVVVRPEDTKESLLEKVRLATILGTFQSTLTNFKYVSAAWKKNCSEERLLGV